MLDFKSMTVDQIRESLKQIGLTEEEVQAIKGKTNLVAKFLELQPQTGGDAGFSTEFDELSMEVNDNDAELAEQLANTPHRTSPEWHDFVMGHFLPDETVPSLQDANVRLPTVDGLRRVAELLVGEIMESYPETVKPSSHEDRTATVQYYIKFDTPSGLKTFGGVANCALWNSEPAFFKFQESNAETRAEARALRKALALRKVVAAEEMTKQEDDFEMCEPISDMQITVIDKLCRENNINVMKYINSGKKKYNTIGEVSKTSAGAMVQWINEYNRQAQTFPQSIVGYDENWRGATS